MVACGLQMYSFMGHIPAACKASSTNDHSHKPSPTCQFDMPAILQSTQWWNTSSTFIIAYVATQHSLT